MRFRKNYQGKCLVSVTDTCTGENLNIDQMVDKLNEFQILVDLQSDYIEKLGGWED